MNIADYAAKLAVAKNIDPTPLLRAAERAAQRATLAANGKYSFHVQRTNTGAKIIGYSLVNGPQRIGDELVRKMIAPELARARSEVAAGVRESLSP